MILRNIQEQVQKNKDDIESLKQAGMGHEPIPGPMGPTGPRGEQGVRGERGPGYYGTASMLPSTTAYEEGDMFLLNDGSLYKNVRGHWVRQASMRGPQGIQGETGTEVIANPEGEPQDMLDTIGIDGVRYSINSTVYFGDIEGDPNDNGALAEELQEIRYVAEGKCKSYVLDFEMPIPSDTDLRLGEYYLDTGEHITSMAQLTLATSGLTYGNPSFNSQSSSLSMGSSWILVQTELENLTRFVIIRGAVGTTRFGPKTGDVIWVKQTEVPDRWYGTARVWHRMETAKIDLANYAALNTANTFTAKQTFPSIVAADIGLEKNQYNDHIVSVNGIPSFRVLPYVLETYSLRPASDNAYNFGTSSLRYKDIYASNSLDLRNTSQLSVGIFFQNEYASGNIRMSGYGMYLETGGGDIQSNNNFKVGSGNVLKIGDTSLSESQLQQLLALIA